jgi:hypothetical protein
MPEMVTIYERKTGKPHKCYPVDANQSLQVKDGEGDDAPPWYVATPEECDKPAKPAAPAKPDKTKK